MFRYLSIKSIFKTTALINNKTNQTNLSVRFLALFPQQKKDDESAPGVKTKELVRVQEFLREEGMTSKFDKKQFINTVEDFDNIRKLKRLGYAEFIIAALPMMKEFGVEKDIESYKALLNIFPKGAFLPPRKISMGFFPYFVQQNAAKQLLDQMVVNNVMPDKEFETHLIDVFSKYSVAWLHCARITYWLTKMKNINPFPFPEKMPTEPLELAIVALRRMTIYHDSQTEVYVYRTTQVDESAAEDTWMCFVQSDSQCQLIEDLDFEQYRVSFDGPYNVWVQENFVSYYILIARDTKPAPDQDLVEKYLSEEHENHNVSDIPLASFGQLTTTRKEAVDPMRAIHQQEDGTILAIAATGTSSQESLICCLRKLQQHNPRLHSVPVIIKSKSDSQKNENVLNSFVYNLNNPSFNSSLDENQSKNEKDPQK